MLLGKNGTKYRTRSIEYLDEFLRGWWWVLPDVLLLHEDKVQGVEGAVDGGRVRLLLPLHIRTLGLGIVASD